MIDARYMAGLFDGEGCICLTKSAPRESGYSTYSIRCVLSMCHKPIIKMVQSQFGGLYSERKGTDKQRNSFSLMWTNNKAKPLLELLLPHLILKREEADVALDYLKRLRHPGTSFWRKASQEEIDNLMAEREMVRTKMALLKRINHSVKWDADEFGEKPIPETEGQPRAKLRSV